MEHSTNEMIDIKAINDKIEKESAFIDLLTMEMNKVIVGQKHMVERLLIGLLGKGHILLEGVPGLAKTLAINTLSQAVKGSFSRIQFTPDLLPADVVGTMIYNIKENDFSIKEWLLDENQKNTLFISSRSSLHGSIQPLISAMLDIAINNMGELPLGNQQKTWLIFDEVSSLNYLPSLEKGLTVSRNFGGCFVIALQSISQLIKRYGQQDSNTISSNCSNKIILKRNL